MIIDLHYNFNKLSINGAPKWRVPSGLQLEQSGSLGMQKSNKHTYTPSLYIYHHHHQVVSQREYAKKHVWRRKKPERKIEDTPAPDEGQLFFGPFLCLFVPFLGFVSLFLVPDEGRLFFWPFLVPFCAFFGLCRPFFGSR